MKLCFADDLLMYSVSFVNGNYCSHLPPCCAHHFGNDLVVDGIIVTKSKSDLSVSVAVMCYRPLLLDDNKIIPLANLSFVKKNVVNFNAKSTCQR